MIAAPSRMIAGAFRIRGCSMPTAGLTGSSSRALDIHPHFQEQANLRRNKQHVAERPSEDVLPPEGKVAAPRDARNDVRKVPARLSAVGVLETDEDDMCYTPIRPVQPVVRLSTPVRSVPQRRAVQKNDSDEDGMCF